MCVNIIRYTGTLTQSSFNSNAECVPDAAADVAVVVSAALGCVELPELEPDQEHFSIRGSCDPATGYVVQHVYPGPGCTGTPDIRRQDDWNLGCNWLTTLTPQNGVCTGGGARSLSVECTTPTIVTTTSPSTLAPTTPAAGGEVDDDGSDLTSGSGDDDVASTAETTVPPALDDDSVAEVDSSGSASDDDSSDAGATVGYVFLALFLIVGLVGGVIYVRKNRLSLPSLPSLSSCFGTKPASNSHTPFQISNPMYGGGAKKRLGPVSSTFQGLDATVA